MNTLRKPSPSSEPARSHLRVLDGGATRVAQRRVVALDWTLVGLVVTSTVFAAAFVKYVLYPAITTLVGG
jgi:hypothetical protein